ncbi:MAG: hypothetical protein JWM10_4100 [Myxococcaceae bacterium]|nr:hypothetical protein [Myxococcaceae bacterium]
MNAPKTRPPRGRDKFSTALDRLAELALHFGDGNLALSVLHARERCAPGAALDVELMAAHANTIAAALIEIAKEERHGPVDVLEFLTLAADLAGCVYDAADIAGRPSVGEPMPSAARVIEHARANPVPWGLPDDCDVNCPAGLWLMRGARGDGLVLLYPYDATSPGTGVFARAVHPLFGGMGSDEMALEDDGETFVPLDAAGHRLPTGGA